MRAILLQHMLAQPKIHQVNPIMMVKQSNQQILPLDVAIQNPFTMQKLHPIHQLQPNQRYSPRRKDPTHPLHQLLQRRAQHIQYHQIVIRQSRKVIYLRKPDSAENFLQNIELIEQSRAFAFAALLHLGHDKMLRPSRVAQTNRPETSFPNHMPNQVHPPDESAQELVRLGGLSRRRVGARLHRRGMMGLHDEEAWGHSGDCA